MSNSTLTVKDHSRDSAGMHYVYPVISRRAGGVSVGINLNTNNACNWRCIYCQVPNLTRGSAPLIDMQLLEQELRGFLHELLQGNFMQTRVPEDSRRINDIALSGNGEPTTAKEFSQVIDLIEFIRIELKVPAEIKTVLITNGSMMHRPEVQAGVAKLSRINGEVWFKLDRGSAAGMLKINDTQITLDKVQRALRVASELCPTWLQTCWFAIDNAAPSTQEEDDYLNFVSEQLHAGSNLKGVLLYTIARQSFQPEATRLSALSPDQLSAFAERIRRAGLDVKVSV